MSRNTSRKPMKSASKSGAKGGAAKGRAKRSSAKPVLLSGGNPQIAKADGDAPVQTYIAALRPVPPGSGKDKDSRWIDIYEGGLDVKQMAGWIRQAAAIPGWRGF